MARPARNTRDYSAEMFSGSRDAFQMLRRLAMRGNLRNYNDVIAGELIRAGYATTREDDLVPTEEGLQASQSFSMPRMRP